MYEKFEYTVVKASVNDRTEKRERRKEKFFILAFSFDLDSTAHYQLT